MGLEFEDEAHSNRLLVLELWMLLDVSLPDKVGVLSFEGVAVGLFRGRFAAAG